MLALTAMSVVIAPGEEITLGTLESVTAEEGLP